MTDSKTPRRFKVPSEMEDGESGRVERDEYRRWRRQTLANERDDLALRARLLEEEAEVLRARAGARRSAALEKLTPQDWLDRMAAKGRGEEPPPLPGGSADELVAEAETLEREAAEARQFIAETTAMEDEAA